MPNQKTKGEYMAELEERLSGLEDQVRDLQDRTRFDPDKAADAIVQKLQSGVHRGGEDDQEAVGLGTYH